MATVTDSSPSLSSYSYKVFQPERTIRYIQTYDDALVESQASSIALHGSFLGLDIEWRPNWIKGAPERRAALIQLASRHEVLLFHVHRVGESVLSHFSCDGVIFNAVLLSRPISTRPHSVT